MANLTPNEICAVLCSKRQYKQHDREKMAMWNFAYSRFVKLWKSNRNTTETFIKDVLAVKMRAIDRQRPCKARARPFSNFAQQLLPTCNRVCKRTCKIQQFWARLYGALLSTWNLPVFMFFLLYVFQRGSTVCDKFVWNATSCCFWTVFGRAFKLFQYDVSSAPVSVHLPVSRFLAGQLILYPGCQRLFRFLSSLYSDLRPTAEDVSAFGQHQKFPPYARKASGTQGIDIRDL